MATQERSVKGSGSSEFPLGMDLLNHQGLNKGTAFTDEGQGLTSPKRERYVFHRHDLIRAMAERKQ